MKISLDVAADALDSVSNNHIDFDTVVRGGKEIE